MIFAVTKKILDKLNKDNKAKLRYELRPQESFFASEEGSRYPTCRIKISEPKPVSAPERKLPEDKMIAIEQLKREPIYRESRDFFFADLRTVNRRQHLFFVHALTGLTLSLQLGDLRFEDGVKSLAELLFDLLIDAGWKEEDIRAWGALSEETILLNSGKPAVRSFMNSSIREFYFYIEEIPPGTKLLTRANRRYNRSNSFFLAVSHGERASSSNNLFSAYLEEQLGHPIQQSFKALQIRVRLALPEGSRREEKELSKQPLPVRDFIIPQSYNLLELSYVLMRMLHLAAYHLTMFILPKKKPEQPYEIQVCECEENFMYTEGGAYVTEQTEMPPEERTRELLMEETDCAYLAAWQGRKITWEYDFGDGFSYELKVKEVRTDKYQVTYLGGANDPVPADVGGYGGWLRFRRALENPQTAEERSLLGWALGVVLWRPFAEQQDAYLKKHFAAPRLFADYLDETERYWRELPAPQKELQKYLEDYADDEEIDDEEELILEEFLDRYLAEPSLAEDEEGPERLFAEWPDDPDVRTSAPELLDLYDAFADCNWFEPVDRGGPDYELRARRARVADTLFAMIHLYGYSNRLLLQDYFAALFPEDPPIQEQELDDLIEHLPLIRRGSVVYDDGSFKPALEDRDEEVYAKLLPHILWHGENGLVFLPDPENIPHYGFASWYKCEEADREMFDFLYSLMGEKEGSIQVYEAMESLCQGAQLLGSETYYAAWAQALNLRELMSPEKRDQFRKLWPKWQKNHRRWIFGGFSLVDYPFERGNWDRIELRRQLMIPFSELGL